MRMQNDSTGLIVTPEGCHVWPGDAGRKRCRMHGTDGCCLIAHGTPAQQRAFHQARCGACGQFLRSDSYYLNRCSNCWTPEDEFIY